MKTLTVLSLGAGVQSSCLYLMAVAGEITPMPDLAIFADTQWEPQRVYDWLDRSDAHGGGTIPITRVTAGSLRTDVWRPKAKGRRQPNMPLFTRDVGGGDGMLLRTCTTSYKVEPIEKEIRRLMGVGRRQRVPPEWVVHQWFGISIDEITRMREPRHKWSRHVYPLIDRQMTRNDCIQWLESQGWKDPPKSACVTCPYRSDASWRAMRDHFPDDWAESVEFDRRLRTKDFDRPSMKATPYLHAQRVPLDMVDLETAEDRGN